MATEEAEEQELRDQEQADDHLHQHQQASQQYLLAARHYHSSTPNTLSSSNTNPSTPSSNSPHTIYRQEQQGTDFSRTTPPPQPLPPMGMLPPMAMDYNMLALDMPMPMPTLMHSNMLQCSSTSTTPLATTITTSMPDTMQPPQQQLVHHYQAVLHPLHQQLGEQHQRQEADHHQQQRELHQLDQQQQQQALILADSLPHSSSSPTSSSPPPTMPMPLTTITAPQLLPLQPPPPHITSTMPMPPTMHMPIMPPPPQCYQQLQPLDPTMSYHTIIGSGPEAHAGAAGGGYSNQITTSDGQILQLMPTSLFAPYAPLSPYSVAAQRSPQEGDLPPVHTLTTALHAHQQGGQQEAQTPTLTVLSTPYSPTVSSSRATPALEMDMATLMQHQQDYEMEQYQMQHQQLEQLQQQQQQMDHQQQQQILADQTQSMAQQPLAKKRRGGNATPSTTKRRRNSSVGSTSPHSTTLPSGRIKCLECDKEFTKNCYLTQHNKSFHSGEYQFRCQKCGKRFQSEDVYTTHLGRHRTQDKPHKWSMEMDMLEEEDEEEELGDHHMIIKSEYVQEEFQMIEKSIELY
ncbi:GD15564 [Drosophila simulans]|uniref:GD15564 n=1 Tax=Drosophila simulans TaxID=7240 RepID=B4R7T8_DROSI|nr:GD15564 [Drosophila simulans]